MEKKGSVSKEKANQTTETAVYSVIFNYRVPVQETKCLQVVSHINFVAKYSRSRIILVELLHNFLFNQDIKKVVPLSLLAKPEFT